MNSKKLVLILFALTLVMGTLIGCTKSADKDDSASVTAVPSATAAPTESAAAASAAPEVKPSGKEITLTTWDGGQEGEEEVFYQTLYAEFMKKYPHIKINRVNASKSGPDGGGMNQQAALAAGTGPALISWFPFVQYVKLGYVAALDDYMKDWPDAKDINPNAMKFSKYVDGKTYALPSMFSYMSPDVVYYRKDNAIASGIDVTKEPKTWAEFEEWTKKFSDNGFKSLLSVDYANGFNAANGALRDEKDADGYFKFVLNSPENVETYEFVQGLFNKGYVDITEARSSQTYLDKFITGKAGFMLENFGQLGRSLLPGGVTDDQIGIINFPSKDGVVKANSMGGGTTAINGTLSKEEQDAAWELLKFLVASKETLRTITWPYQKKVDFRPVMLTTFQDMQDEYLETLEINPKYGEQLIKFSENLNPNNNIAYNDLWNEVAGVNAKIYLDNAPVKETLDKLAELINKEVIERENQRVKEEKFYQDLKNKK